MRSLFLIIFAIGKRKIYQHLDGAVDFLFFLEVIIINDKDFSKLFFLKKKGADFLYLELHHRVLAEFVSTGSGDLIQANELGLVADAITLKAPDESRFAAILPCGHTHTHTNVHSILRYIFQSRTSIYCRPAPLPQDHQSLEDLRIPPSP